MSKRVTLIDEIVFDTGGYPVGKKQLETVVGSVLRQSGDLTESMRHALMVEHHTDWSMEIVAEAAYICANVAQEAATLRAVELAEKARSLIEDLADDDDCTFDHHGYCQAHVWMTTDPVCPHKRAKEYLAQLQGKGEAE